MFLEPEKRQIKTSEISDEFEFDEMNLFHLDIDRHRWESTGIAVVLALCRVTFASVLEESSKV